MAGPAKLPPFERSRHEDRADYRMSSGYGLETARHFYTHGWNVIATMRTPREDILPDQNDSVSWRSM